MKTWAQGLIFLALGLLAGCLGSSTSFTRHYPTDALAPEPPPSHKQILEKIQDIASQRGYIYIPREQDKFAAFYSWQSGAESVFLTVTRNIPQSSYTFMIFSWPGAFPNKEATALSKQLQKELPASTGNFTDESPKAPRPPQRP